MERSTIRVRVWLVVCCLGAMACGGRLEAQVELSPRIGFLRATADDYVALIGLRGRWGDGQATPYTGLYLRSRSVDVDSGPAPSGRAVQAVVGINLQGGRPGSVRPHFSVGGGLVSWQDDVWGNEFVVEVETGVTVPTSESFGLHFAFRLDWLNDRGTSGGGTAGIVWRVGG